MPLKRPPVPKDSPQVIAVRERLKPTDTQTIVAKNAKGELVICKPDGSYVPFICPESQRDIIAKELKNGGAEDFAYRLINTHRRRMGTAASQGWIPVKKSEKIACCPYAYGDETSALICDSDTILHRRPLETHRAASADRKLLNAMQMASPEEQLRIAASATPHVKDYVHTETEGSPEDGLTLGQPGV